MLSFAPAGVLYAATAQGNNGGDSRQVNYRIVVFREEQMLDELKDKVNAIEEKITQIRGYL